LATIRRSTYSDRPLARRNHPHVAEETKRRLVPQNFGPKKRIDKSQFQETFSFGA
jgi:hypothetical protein